MCRFSRAFLAVVVLSVTGLMGCQYLVPQHLERFIKPTVELSEIVGFLAGLGTTFAAFPDLIAMLRRRSSEGISLRMGTIMGAFQILWVYYGLLIESRPVIIGNVIAVLINFLTVGAYSYFLRHEKAKSVITSGEPNSSL